MWGSKSRKSSHTSHTVAIPKISGVDRLLAHFGGRNSAISRVILWRNKKISVTVLGVVTAIWALFEYLEYNLLTLVCHLLITVVTVLFLWSTASAFFTKRIPKIPYLYIPEQPVLQFVSSLNLEINWALNVLREIASRRDHKKLLLVVAGLGVFSILGNYANVLTLFYIAFVLLHTVTVFYERYEVQINSIAGKVNVIIKKLYAKFNAKVLSKIPFWHSKDKKKN